MTFSKRTARRAFQRCAGGGIKTKQNRQDLSALPAFLVAQVLAVGGDGLGHLLDVVRYKELLYIMKPLRMKIVLEKAVLAGGPVALSESVIQ